MDDTTVVHSPSPDGGCILLPRHAARAARWVSRLGFAAPAVAKEGGNAVLSVPVATLLPESVRGQQQYFALIGVGNTADHGTPDSAVTALRVVIALPAAGVPEDRFLSGLRDANAWSVLSPTISGSHVSYAFAYSGPPIAAGDVVAFSFYVSTSESWRSGSRTWSVTAWSPQAQNIATKALVLSDESGADLLTASVEHASSRGQSGRRVPGSAP